ncbi:MAG: hypothetical protein ACI9Y7_003015, partial [Dokdonia sp.]
MSFPKKIFKLDRTLFFLMAAFALIVLLVNCKGNTES